MDKIKILCLVVLGFCLGFFSGKAHGFDENGEAFCLAQNIYFEAGNQPLAGKLAVAHVVRNRVEDSQFPDTYCGVIYQTKKWRTSWTGNQVPVLGMCQFSWFCDGKSDEPKDSKTWEVCLQIAQSFIKEEQIDITEGAMWYHADYILPYWAEHLNNTVYINNHIFYK
mgnify:CR=1 FL=1